MWEVLGYIIQYLVEQGGFWGLLVALALAWIAFREWSLAKKKKAAAVEETPKPNLLQEDTAIIKERQEDQIRFIEQNSERLNEVNQKLQDISLHIDNFVNINQSNSEKIEKLSEQLQQVNDERVEELKELLNSYNRTMNELALTLQKIKFVLQTRLGED
jgi:hypothetical protein